MVKKSMNTSIPMSIVAAARLSSGSMNKSTNTKIIIIMNNTKYAITPASANMKPIPMNLAMYLAPFFIVSKKAVFCLG